MTEGTPQRGVLVSYLALMLALLLAALLAWFLREVPPRALDLGNGLSAGAPERRSPADEAARTRSKLACADIRRRGYERLAVLAGLDLPAGSCWVLARLAKQGGAVLAAQPGVSSGGSAVDRLVAAGMVVRDDASGVGGADGDGVLRLTAAGQVAADRLFAARRDGLRELLAGWSPEQHAELAELLNRLSHALLGRHLSSAVG